MNGIIQHFSTLELVDGELRKKCFDNHGNVLSLLVVPESVATSVITHLHVAMAHANCWRLQSFLAKTYFISRLNILLRDTYKACLKCQLSQAPKSTKGRKITVTSSQPTQEINVDLLHLPAKGPYKFVLVATDLCSGYVFARALRARGSRDTANALLDICFSNGFLCHVVSHDQGKEFQRHFTDAISSTAASHIANSVLFKNSNPSESANARLLNLLRRLLNESQDWISELQRCVFSLNCSSMRYGNFVTTPSMIFNNRCITGVPDVSQDVESSSLQSQRSIRELMTRVSRHRLLDTPSLAVHLTQRPHEYRVGERCLVWAERILAKKMLKNSILKIKLSRFWRIAVVQQALGHHYMLLTNDGKLRRAHRRQMKPFPDSIT